MSLESTQRDLNEANRLSWNEATKAHNSHKGDQAAFFRQGGMKLYDEEVALLGDIRGKRVVHLQCNAGQDTLSMAQLGGVMTGVDISDEAVAFATGLSRDSGVPATFVRADIYDWLEGTANHGEKFDVVFSSYGAICWLFDLQAWAKGISRILAPGGRFVLVEFHPFAMMYETDWTLKYDYFPFRGAQKWDDGIGDYVAMSGEGLTLHEWQDGVQNFKNPHPSYEYSWPVSEVISALIGAGLRLESFHEYPYSNGFKGWDNMRSDGRRCYAPESKPDMPLMYSVSAIKD